MNKYASVAAILRAAAIEKDAGVVRGTLGAMEAAGKAGSQYLKGAGHKNLAAAARVAPHAVAVTGLYGASQTEPAQAVIRSGKVWNYKRKVRAAQRAQSQRQMMGGRY